MDTMIRYKKKRYIERVFMSRGNLLFCVGTFSIKIPQTLNMINLFLTLKLNNELLTTYLIQSIARNTFLVLDTKKSCQKFKFVQASLRVDEVISQVVYKYMYRLAAITCVTAHTATHVRLTHNYHITNAAIEKSAVEMLSLILPGVLGALQDVATCNDNPGHLLVVVSNITLSIVRSH